MSEIYLAIGDSTLSIDEHVDSDCELCVSVKSGGGWHSIYLTPKHIKAVADHLQSVLEDIND